MIFRYELGQEEYTLDIRGKYNVIIGDSGSGKTGLTRFAARFDEAPKKLIKSMPLPLYGSQDETSARIKEAHHSIIVIDERAHLSSMDDIIKLTRSSDNYFIICTREGSAEIPYGVNTTFVIEGKWPIRRMVPAYPKLRLTRRVPYDYHVLVEDGELGLNVMQAVRGKENVDTAKGKDGLIPVLANTTIKCVVVFDKCGIGSKLPKLVELAQIDGHVLFDSISFEYEVLSKCFPYYLFDYERPEFLRLFSEEAYYEFALNECLKSLYGFGYHKESKVLEGLLTVGHAIVNKVPITLTKAVYEKLYEEFRQFGVKDREVVNNLKL